MSNTSTVDESGYTFADSYEGEEEQTKVVHKSESGGVENLLSKYKKTEEELESIKKKKVKKFYKHQNEAIDSFLLPIEQEDNEEKNDLKLKIAMRASLVANILLFGMQLSAAVYSGSLALISTTIDAFMDILANTILFLTDWWKKKKNYQKYPVGKSRMEPVGIILFSTLMSFMSLEIMREAAGVLIAQEKPDLHIDAIPITLSTVGIAMKAILFIYCRTLTYSPSGMTLAQDHRNDVVLNTFGIAIAVLGYYVYWWVDSVGAILIALIILRSWSITAYEQIGLLVGKTASPTFLNKLTYIAATHHPDILQVDTCRAFHVGTDTYVELDIVLPKSMPLEQTHDIAESLQIKLEKIPGVERAFVHSDYSTNHKAEDEHKNPF